MTPRDVTSLTAAAVAAAGASALVFLGDFGDLVWYDIVNAAGVTQPVFEPGFALVALVPILAAALAVGGVVRFGHGDAGRSIGPMRGLLLGLVGGILAFPLAALILGLGFGVAAIPEGASIGQYLSTTLFVGLFVLVYGTILGFVGFAPMALPVAAAAGLIGALAARAVRPAGSLGA